MLFQDTGFRLEPVAMADGHVGFGGVDACGRGCACVPRPKSRGGQQIRAQASMRTFGRARIGDRASRGFIITHRPWLNCHPRRGCNGMEGTRMAGAKHAGSNAITTAVIMVQPAPWVERAAATPAKLVRR